MFIKCRQNDAYDIEMKNQILPEALHDELVLRNACLNGLFFTKIQNCKKICQKIYITLFTLDDKFDSVLNSRVTPSLLFIPGKLLNENAVRFSSVSKSI